MNTIIACDFKDKTTLDRFLDSFQEEKPMLKIGMELFYAEGPALINDLHKQGYKIFLDLKMHDIPQTVHNAMKSIGRLNVAMTNVHAAGGIAMMQAAKAGLKDVNANTILIAVTQLTSIDQETLNHELLINQEIEKTIIHYAQNAKKAGLEGVVSSVHEAKAIKEACGKEFLTITPGIRLLDQSHDDQKRVATPTFALSQGTDYIVVGRSITQAKNPLLAYKEIKGVSQAWNER